MALGLDRLQAPQGGPLQAAAEQVDAPAVCLDVLHAPGRAGDEPHRRPIEGGVLLHVGDERRQAGGDLHQDRRVDVWK
jgi:hypothetical protein